MSVKVTGWNSECTTCMTTMWDEWEEVGVNYVESDVKQWEKHHRCEPRFKRMDPETTAKIEADHAKQMADYRARLEGRT
jgi:hypothetical protein